MYKLTAVQIAFLVAKLGNRPHHESYVHEQLSLALGGSANMMRNALDSERRTVFDATIAALEVDSMNRENDLTGLLVELEIGSFSAAEFVRDNPLLAEHEDADIRALFLNLKQSVESDPMDFPRPMGAPQYNPDQE